MAAKDVELMTPGGLRRHLNISKPTYTALVREGMPHVKVTPKAWRFDLTAVREWLEGRTKDKGES